MKKHRLLIAGVIRFVAAPRVLGQDAARSIPHFQRFNLEGQDGPRLI
jgi:hypothetical protein